MAADRVRELTYDVAELPAQPRACYKKKFEDIQLNHKVVTLRHGNADQKRPMRRRPASEINIGRELQHHSAPLRVSLRDEGGGPKGSKLASHQHHRPKQCAHDQEVTVQKNILGKFAPLLDNCCREGK